MPYIRFIKHTLNFVLLLALAAAIGAALGLIHEELLVPYWAWLDEVRG